MLIESPKWQRFNDSGVPDAAHTQEWQNRRGAAPGQDARIWSQSRPYWVTDLSGVTMNERQKNENIGIHRRNGDVIPILMRVSIFCEIGRFNGRNALGNAIVIPEPIGTGDGTLKSFQLKTRLYVSGYDNEYLYYPVKFPHWKYPPMIGIAETTGGPVPYDPMPEVKLFANGVPLTEAQFTVNRENSGMVSTNASGVISATGGFYVPMLLPPRMPIKNDPQNRYGNYIFADGIELREPVGVI